MSGNPKAEALNTLRLRASECPRRGEVPTQLAQTMLAVALAAKTLGATDDEVRDAMYAGYADADLRDGLTEGEL